LELKEAVILITGGSSGIGKSAAARLVEEGAVVYITGRDIEKLELAAKEIGANPLLADMTSDEQLANALKHILDSSGRLDVLINNAGIGSFGPVDELSRSNFREVFEVNVYGAGIMGALCAAHFKEREKGHILNIGSSASVKGFKNGSVYSASKFALRGLSQCWKDELRPYNVRVTHINPSEVTTAFYQEDRKEREEQPNKLRAMDLAQLIVSCLELDDRGFIPEVNLWATNPF
jgi:3-oxoacyl-[acyl-carrier protein] reductase